MVIAIKIVKIIILLTSIKMDAYQYIHAKNLPFLAFAHILNAPTKVSLLKMVSVKIVEIIFILICK